MIYESRVINPDGVVYQHWVHGENFFLDPPPMRLRNGELLVPPGYIVEPPWAFQTRRDGGDWVTLDQNVGGSG